MMNLIRSSNQEQEEIIQLCGGDYSSASSSPIPATFNYHHDHDKIHDQDQDHQSYEMKPECYECKGMAGEWISMQYCIYFCENCATQLQGRNMILELFHLNELHEFDLLKLSIGGNKRFRQFLKCLSLLKGYHFDTPSEIYTSPSVLYYRDILQDEFDQRHPRPYNEEYYEELSKHYSTEFPEVARSGKNKDKIIPRWTPDDTAIECMICNCPFTFLNRRHHCRTCGLCLCGDCAPSTTKQLSLLSSWRNSSKQHFSRQCKRCLKQNSRLLS